ncbi:MAG: hypothetical protein AB1679_04640 [Actinomycetota bacterium]
MGNKRRRFEPAWPGTRVTITERPIRGPAAQFSNPVLDLLVRTRGVTAGAVGTLALESVTYVDMVLTGRPESELPAEAAGRLAGSFGVDLGESAANRRRALGALLGFANGVAVGVGYAFVAGPDGGQPSFRRGLGLGLAAMAASAGPAAVSSLTDPRRWGWRGWLEDLVPHLAYGLAATRAYAALRCDAERTSLRIRRGDGGRVRRWGCLALRS